MSYIVVAGLDDHHQLATPGDSTSTDGYVIIKSPRRIRLQSSIAVIAAAEFHTIFVTSTGEALAVGSDKKFRIGSVNRTEYRIPAEISVKDGPVKSACAGHCYSAYLTHEGKLVVATSRSVERSQLVPPVQKPLVYIAGSDVAACGIDSSGSFYLFRRDPMVAPRKYKLGKPVFDIARGNSMTLVVNVDGVAYGNGRLNKHNRKFARIPSLADVTVRRCFSHYDHAAVITTDGKVMLWGDGIYGQMGNGSKNCNDDFHEVMIPGKVVSVGLGMGHSVFVTEDGDVYSCGWNEFGELLLGHTQTRILVPIKWALNARATRVFCGMHNTFVECDGSPVPHPGAQFFGVTL